MIPKLASDPSLPPDKDSVPHSNQWSEHEHVSEQVQLEAQKLVEMVGSPELAKHAIDVVEQRQQTSLADHSGIAAPLPMIERHAPFLKALEDFEGLLETPIIAGELLDWVTNALSACENVGLILTGDLKRKHAELYARILRQDLDLSRQVEKLRAMDRQLVDIDFANVLAALTQLSNFATSVAQDEAKLTLLRTDVVKRAISFVISARTQETALATWFSEAFNRDLGVSG